MLFCKPNYLFSILLAAVFMTGGLTAQEQLEKDHQAAQEALSRALDEANIAGKTRAVAERVQGLVDDELRTEMQIVQSLYENTPLGDLNARNRPDIQREMRSLQNRFLENLKNEFPDAHYVMDGGPFGWYPTDKFDLPWIKFTAEDNSYYANPDFSGPSYKDRGAGMVVAAQLPSELQQVEVKSEDASPLTFQVAAAAGEYSTHIPANGKAEDIKLHDPALEESLILTLNQLAESDLAELIEQCEEGGLSCELITSEGKSFVGINKNQVVDHIKENTSNEKEVEATLALFATISNQMRPFMYPGDIGEQLEYSARLKDKSAQGIIGVNVTGNYYEIQKLLGGTAQDLRNRSK